MEKYRLPLLLLWLTTVFVMNVINAAEGVEEDEQLKNLTNKVLEEIPFNENSTTVKILVIKGNLISLSDKDGLALTSYPTLVELYLDSNQVTVIPANYFSVLPKLRVLSLARNNISSLDPEAFSGLNDLTALDLSCNLLTSLPAQTFKGLKSLKTLNLRGNPWNCSCALLRPIGEINAANVTIEEPTVKCASPAEQAGKSLLEATALCSSSPTSTQQPSIPGHSQTSSTVLMTTLSSSQNNSLNKDQTPILGNTWKFTSSIIALGLTTSMLILCAIKGPSWYKLFHNYRHRLLREDEREDGTVPSFFSEAGAYPAHQTFTFTQNRQTEEEDVDQDGYFEDSYIKSEE
ncbi:leucine-rich repeat-containing protein 19-like [Mugil cephalus]|uniref:leucine-rich repeat-containing protein 19-like n=1 Tax=Mugil cephalus TaxID=48193 RepID=UPI001FB59A28|nr:leucine-rich repeat-containing protein 19-like [Mugil cephalus]